MWFRIASASLIFCAISVPVLSAAEVPDFNHDVLPLFRKHCVACHNSKNAEAGLVLQNHLLTMKGGEGGEIIIPGRSAESLLWKVVTATDDTRMPPKGQPPLQPGEIMLIQKWIDGGASPPIDGAADTGLITPKVAVQKKTSDAITAVAFSPDNQWTVIARPHFVEVTNSLGTRRLEGHSGTINDISFSNDGSWLCVAAGETGLSGEVTLWRTADWTRGPVFQGHGDAVYSSQLSPDGKLLATASYDRDIILWNVATVQPIQTLRGHNDAVYGLSFSPNGKLIATASGDRTIKLWDVASGQRLDTFAQPSKEQTTVTFSPDGQFLAAGGADARIRIWQISESGSEGTNPILYSRFAHEGPILKLVYSRDGKLLASASQDGNIKIWETRSYTQVAMLERQPDWAAAMSFSPDGRSLFVGRMNGESKRYSVDPSWADSASDLKRLEDAAHSSPASVQGPGATLHESEPNNALAQANPLSIPGSVRGELKSESANAEDIDYIQFTAKSGDRIVFETRAAKDGSLADTKLEILNPDGTPVLRALLQAVRDSWINFRPIDSTSPDVRLEFWEEMDLNQYVYMNGEVCKTFRAPQGPDSGYVLYSIDGKRRDYFDTSGAAHAKDEPAYIVEAFPPGSKIVDNGLPIFPLYYVNDDDGDRKLGKDSSLTFTAPSDGSYLVKVTDVRGASGEKFNYILTARQPNPDFTVTINTMNPKIPAGSGQRLKFTLNRIDQFDDPVRIDIAGLPKGFEASSPVVIQSGLVEAFSVLTAAQDAPEPTQADWDQITVLATSHVNDQLVTRTVGGLGEVKLEKPAAIRVKLIPDDPRFTSSDNGLVIEPGTTITARIVIERNGHEDDVRFDVDNLPHGIIVDNIGLSGVLVRKQETERQIFLTARPWVPETDRLIHAVAQGVGSQASPAIPLHVRKKNSVATR